MQMHYLSSDEIEQLRQRLATLDNHTASTAESQTEYCSTPDLSLFSIIRLIDRNITLWLRYERVYHRLQNNPAARNALKNHPGVKFMRAGWRIFWVLTLLLFCLYVNR